jgi:predicted transposase YdaD
MREVRHEPGVIRRIIQYIGAVRRLDEHRTIIDILATELGPEEAQAMQTIWEAAEQQGERRGLEKGRQEGRQEGQRKLLVRMLQRRFGHLPAAVLARIERADEASLERWSEELLDAPDLAALFPPA